MRLCEGNYNSGKEYINRAGSVITDINRQENNRWKVRKLLLKAKKKVIAVYIEITINTVLV